MSRNVADQSSKERTALQCNILGASTFSTLGDAWQFIGMDRYSVFKLASLTSYSELLETLNNVRISLEGMCVTFAFTAAHSFP